MVKKKSTTKKAQLKKEKSDLMKFKKELEAKITYFSKQLIRAESRLDKLDVRIAEQP